MVKTFKVAVYGTLMAGERNERWAVDALERKPCVLRGTLYDTGWGYPAFIPNMDGGGVKAELLTITADTLTRMDVLEGYPRLYRRETVLAVLVDGNIEVVMVYVMNKLPRRAMVIPSGDWRKFRAKKESVDIVELYLIVFCPEFGTGIVDIFNICRATGLQPPVFNIDAQHLYVDGLTSNIKRTRQPYPDFFRNSQGKNCRSRCGNAEVCPKPA